ncbi:MAG TPA: ADP-ribosylglycohydrolase family protein [Propionibacteriaceae bacterium]|nr:ADP-ribosylglycohydrolase family protein [Propionibacteriaceae bacterium]
MAQFSLDRAAGVLLGQACGDALGVPYEFGSARLSAAGPAMIGGGLGGYAPGEWSDDTQMAACIALVAATGADLTSDAALDEIAAAFLDWGSNGATDIGNQTRNVLRLARQRTGPAGARLLTAARDHGRHNSNDAGNGALMRTAIVGLTRMDDRDATADAARAVAGLTHPADDAVDSCVLWSEAVRRAVLDGELNLTDGLDLLPPGRRDRWRGIIGAAETSPPSTFTSNGWTVTALQAAWSAIVHTPVPDLNPSAGTFPCQQLQSALDVAVGIGHDTDTVAAIAGGLLGARWGASALPARWRRIVHGWPSLHSRDLIRLSWLTATRGKADGSGWPEVDVMAYPVGRQPRVPHPADEKVLLGTVADLGQGETAAVSLCRLGASEVPTRGVATEDHIEFWLLDSDEPAKNPHLDYLLADIATTIAELRDEGHTVLVHCVAAEQRTPSAALAYSRRVGLPAGQASSVIKAALPSARGHGRLWERAALVVPASPSD